MKVKSSFLRFRSHLLLINVVSWVEDKKKKKKAFKGLYKMPTDMFIKIRASIYS